MGRSNIILVKAIDTLQERTAYHSAQISYPNVATAVFSWNNICNHSGSLMQTSSVAVEHVFKSLYVLSATVLADPPACKHLSTTNNQYADVGVNASPTLVTIRRSRHKMNDIRRPFLSAMLPQIEGA